MLSCVRSFTLFCTHFVDVMCAAISTKIQCSMLSAPANGVVSFSGEELGVGIIANFSSDPGFIIVGNTTVTYDVVSGTTGNWSGSTPYCM